MNLIGIGLGWKNMYIFFTKCGILQKLQEDPSGGRMSVVVVEMRSSEERYRVHGSSDSRVT